MIKTALALTVLLSLTSAADAAKAPNHSLGRGSYLGHSFGRTGVVRIGRSGHISKSSKLNDYRSALLP